ncbi:MAG: MOSC domain-containing protein [Alphaproteobacteria bacterium]|nr:MOSC domain-containing protein [Alphaproteobacteria bacterium]
MLDWNGRIVALHSCAAASQPMTAHESLTLIAGKGIAGDRYLLGTGYYSQKPEEGRQVTLFEIETLLALRRDYDVVLTPAEHRRNVTVEGVPLNHLVGRRFRLGDTLLEATRLSIPCRYLEEVTGKNVFKALMHRSGLNCKIIEGGVIRTGDRVASC